MIDPRGAFASAARFPDTRFAHDWADEALAALGLDTRTAVVTLTHDPKLDNPAIRAALNSDCFYGLTAQFCFHVLSVTISPAGFPVLRP